MVSSCKQCGEVLSGQQVVYCSSLCSNRANSVNMLGEKHPRYKKVMQEIIPCACGCGESLEKYDSRKRERSYIKGHAMKGRKRQPFTDEWKRKQSEAHKGINSGPDHWNWQGGKSDKYLRNSPKYHEWRFAVYKRDNYTCQECLGVCTKDTIVAHHIKEWALYEDLRFCVDNGIVMCRPCHLAHHNRLRKEAANSLTRRKK